MSRQENFQKNPSQYYYQGPPMPARPQHTSPFSNHPLHYQTVYNQRPHIDNRQNPHRQGINLTGNGYNNTAFTQLRSQISSLKSQFNKLIQKQTNTGTHFENKNKNDPYQIKEKRESAPFLQNEYQSNSPLTNTVTSNNPHQLIKKNSSQVNVANYRLGSNDSKIEKKIKNDEVPLQQHRFPKRYSQFSDKKINFTEKTDEYSPYNTQRQIDSFKDTIKILEQKIISFEGQINILKKGIKQKEKENTYDKNLLTQENHILQKQIQEMQQNFNEEKNFLTQQIKNQKIQKNKITINLRDENQKLNRQNQELTISIGLKKGLIEKLQEQLNQNTSLMKRQSVLIQQKRKQEEQQLKKLQESQKTLQKQFIEKQKIYLIEISKAKKIIQQYEQKLNQKVENNTQKQNTTEIDQKISEKTVDLQKRVESYQKSIEQMNVSNNSMRDKQILLKEQNKILQQELKSKQNLVNNLYSDIRILDGQIRQSSTFKTFSNNLSKYIYELNNIIVIHQLSKLNSRLRPQNVAQQLEI